MKAHQTVLLLSLAFLLISLGVPVHASASSVTSQDSGNAIGMADIGVLQTSNGNLSYTTFTNAIIGRIQFNGGDFLSYNGTSYVNQASVQLDGVVKAGNQYFWVQNMPIIQSEGGGLYKIYLSDLVWNITQPGSNISTSIPIGGKGSLTTQNGVTFYEYKDNKPIITKTPFILQLITSANETNNYMNLQFSYSFSNSSTIGIGEFDDFVLGIPQSPLFVIGGENPSGPNGFEMVISASNDFSTLYVNSWNSTMWSGYSYNGEFYTMPSAMSTSFGITGKVSQSHGISETWNNAMDYAVQSSGESTNGFLWNISTSASYSQGKLTVYVTPSDSMWKLTVKNAQTGLEVFSSQINGSSESFNFNANQGYYIADFQMMAGPSLIYTTQVDFSTNDYALVSVSTVVPHYYVNGIEEPSNSTVPVHLPSSICFPKTYQIGLGERLFFKYSLVDGVKEGNIVNITSPGTYTINATYVLQYEVGFPFNVTLTVNGVTENFKLGWINVDSTLNISNQTDYISNGTRAIITSPLSFKVETPINVTLQGHYIIQYLVKFPFNVTIIVDKSTYFVNSSWITKGYTVNLPTQIIPVKDGVRYYVEPSEFQVNEPITFPVAYVVQYLVRFPFNITVSVNGTVMNFAQSWINSSSIVVASLQQIHIAKGVMYNVSSFSFVVNKPMNYTPVYGVYYYVSLTTPVPVNINGENYTINSGYYLKGTHITFYSVFYVNSTERLLVRSNVSQLNLTEPSSISDSYIVQYLIHLPFNMTFSVNGKQETGQSSWVNSGSNVVVKPQFIYVNSTERYSVNGENFTVTAPRSVNLPYTVEYLANINGNRTWYPIGSVIKLQAPQGFFQVVTWQGTYQEPNGATIKVNGPITETSITSTNYVNVGIVTTIIILIIALTVAILLKRSKGGSGNTQK